MQVPACFATFAGWEEVFKSLDPVAREYLKNKASRYLKRGDVKGRDWQQLFDALGEASAYKYLSESEGCSTVRFIPESNETPDLEGVRDHNRVLCEVKTITISDVEVSARRDPPSVRKVSNQLDVGFFRKLDSDIAKATSQLKSYDSAGNAKHLLYMNICFDDFFGLYKEDYLQQIKLHLLEHPPEIEITVSPDFSKTETHVVAQR